MFLGLSFEVATDLGNSKCLFNDDWILMMA